MFLSMILNMLFLLTNNPLMMGLILLLQTMMITIIIGKMSSTFWLSYIIFLIFVGGLLILFLYSMSLINNSKIMFKFNFKQTCLFMNFFMLTYPLYQKNFIMNYEMNFLNNFINLMNENNMNMIKLYNFPNFLINMMMIMYLFFIMIVVTKITIFSKGPFFKI